MPWLCQSQALLYVQTTGHTGKDRLGEALYGCHLVLIPAGVPRKPGMTRDDLFNINASKKLGLIIAGLLTLLFINHPGLAEHRTS